MSNTQRFEMLSALTDDEMTESFPLRQDVEALLRKIYELEALDECITFGFSLDGASRTSEDLTLQEIEALRQALSRQIVKIIDSYTTIKQCRQSWPMLPRLVVGCKIPEDELIAISKALKTKEDSMRGSRVAALGRRSVGVTGAILETGDPDWFERQLPPGDRD